VGSVVPTAARIALILGAIGTFTSPPVANVAVALALVLTLASPPMRARLAFVATQPLGRAALIFLAVMTLAMAWAAVPWKARFDAWWNWRTMLLIVLTAAAFGDPRWKERFCLAVSGAVAIGALASFAAWAAGVTRERGLPGTVLLNHVTQSMALAVGIVLAAVLAAQRDRSLRSRALLASAALVSLADLVLVTAGRSGDVALAVAALAAVLLMVKGPRRWYAVLGLLVVGTALTAASPTLKQRFARVAQEAPLFDCSSQEENSTALRLLLWRTTGTLIRARPWFGYGVGGFAPAYAGEVRNQIGDQTLQNWCARPARDPHNQYLRVTVEAGGFGLLACLGLLAGAARQPAAQPYRSCGLALVAAWSVTSLFNSHFQTFNEGHLIALLLGALLAPDDSILGGEPERQSSPGNKAQAASAPSTASRTSS
jgi:O-antigen ligase